VPTELGRLTALTSLLVNDNELSGTLPAQLSAMTALRVFTAFNNSGLCGPVPTGAPLSAMQGGLYRDGTWGKNARPPPPFLPSSKTKNNNTSWCHLASLRPACTTPLWFRAERRAVTAFRGIRSTRHPESARCERACAVHRGGEIEEIART